MDDTCVLNSLVLPSPSPMLFVLHIWVGQGPPHARGRAGVVWPSPAAFASVLASVRLRLLLYLYLLYLFETTTDPLNFGVRTTFLR